MDCVVTFYFYSKKVKILPLMVIKYHKYSNDRDPKIRINSKVGTMVLTCNPTFGEAKLGGLPRKSQFGQ